MAARRRASPSRRSPTRCPCPDRAAPTSTARSRSPGDVVRRSGTPSVGGVVAPWGITETESASTSKSSTRRRRACSVITTTASAASHDPLEHVRVGAPVGWRSTVWATTIDGTDEGLEDVEHVVAVDGRRRCRTRAARWRRRRRSRHRPLRRSDPARRSSRRRRRADPRSSSRSPQRTTSTVAPLATKPAASAAENVAMPQAVGGNVDRIPNERNAARGRHGPRGDDRPRRAPDVSSVEASSLRRATRPVRPSSPSEATLPRGCASTLPLSGDARAR